MAEIGQPRLTSAAAKAIAALRPDLRVLALGAANALLKTTGPKGPDRSVEHRRKFLFDPWKYIRDVLDLSLTPQQEEVIQAFERHDRVLVPSGNNLGKTFVLAAYGLYCFDVLAAQADKDLGLEEQGARVILPGPDHDTVRATIYAEMLTHARRAEQRGYAMPGRRSEDSVLWKVRPKWEMEGMAPPRRTGQEVAHTASGRHQKVQVALIEEGQGVDERLWKAVEGMCSSRGNKILSSFNPTEASGPTYQRARQPGWYVIHLDAFDHPNVRRRHYVIEAAIDFKMIDQRVASQCQARGRFPEVAPDDNFKEFIYALPPKMAEERGPRDDGFPGHPDGELFVYRPIAGSFQGQVRGQWPTSASNGLFDPGAWDAAVERWKENNDPDFDPDTVGVDPSREGEDDTVCTPIWGESSNQLLESYLDATSRVDETTVNMLLSEKRIRVGTQRISPKGDGPQVAAWIYGQYPYSPITIDETGIGASVLDHAKRVLGLDIIGLNFASAPPEPLSGETLSMNMRAALYIRAARLVNLGLVDIPDDPQLREEVLAQMVKWESRVVEVNDVSGRKRKVRKPAIRLLEKREIKKLIGRSPDKADSFVLSLFTTERLPQGGFEIF
jgi:hypothetical protein